MVTRVTKYSTNQEYDIMELRNFIEDLLYGPDGEPFDFDKVARKRRYVKQRGGKGKTIIDIMKSKMARDKLHLYDSVVTDVEPDKENDDDNDDEIKFLKGKIKKYQEYLENYKAEVAMFKTANEMLAANEKMLEQDIVRRK